MFFPLPLPSCWFASRNPYQPAYLEKHPKYILVTPPKIDIEPENDGLEDDFPLPGVYSQVPAVNLPGCSFSN